MQFSIAICTFNPEPELFAQALSSCRLAAEQVAGTEVLVVDNNSTTPVQLSGDSAAHVKVIREDRQGLAFARIAATRCSAGDVVVFADDDNILDRDYLPALLTLLHRHPSVAAWGPGKIQPRFTGNGPSWIPKEFPEFYQGRNRTDTTFGKEAGWPPYYPSGSGLAVKRVVLERYSDAVAHGKLSSTGRKGDSLASAEDAQIVWTAIKMGYAAGTSPALRLIHLISESKQSLTYLRKLQYNVSHSYYMALTEMFPEKKREITPLSVAGHLRMAFKIFCRSPLRPLRVARRITVEFAWFRGLRAFTNQQGGHP